MDWPLLNFDWNHARAFLATAEEGSLSAAARVLGQAQPTVGRQMKALEEELGVVLFERDGRGLRLTPTGLMLVEHVRQMADAATHVTLSSAGHSQHLEGNVCISASEVYAAYLLPPVVAKLRRDHPGIHVEIVASNAASDLKRREADIALRSFQPTQPDLVGRKLRDAHARLYASPAYLAELGTPRCIDDLANAHFVSFDARGGFLKALQQQKLDVTEANLPLSTENHLVLWEMVKQGLGIGAMDDVIGNRDPAVLPVLHTDVVFSFPVWLVAHRELRKNRRIRVVFDCLAAELAHPG